MLKVLSNILCDLDPKVKVIGRKAGICDVVCLFLLLYVQSQQLWSLRDGQFI